MRYLGFVFNEAFVLSLIILMIMLIKKNKLISKGIKKDSFLLFHKTIKGLSIMK